MRSYVASQGARANSFANRSRARRARAAAALESAYTPRIAAASAAGSSGAINTASREETTSGMPPTAVATIGAPAAMASNIAIGVPSARELSTNTSNAENRRPAPGRLPNQRTRCASPRRAASGTGVDHVRAVAVRMHYIRPDSPADLDHRSPLAEVSPRPKAHRDNLDAGRDEGR